MKHSIYPCLWFDAKAKEAAEFYCSVFTGSEITSQSEMVVMFESAGQKFMLLNGGPEFNINPSVSFYVICENEQEIRETWNALLKDGSALMPLDKYPWSAKYGWVQDRFGVSWQLSLGNVKEVGQKFTPLLMFIGAQAGNAEKAIKFYTKVFKESAIKDIARYVKGENDVEGTIKHSRFRLCRDMFMAMDSSFPHKFGFNEGISFVVTCETQEEIDYFWNRLTDGGEESQCGWLKDQFGVSWQIIPSILGELMSDPSKSQRVINAFLQMKKFDIEKLVNA
jgi:predicted 3-demethylubiquinone-9 3-methyltransferase (glyoxalase superfamily)